MITRPSDVTTRLTIAIILAALSVLSTAQDISGSSAPTKPSKASSVKKAARKQPPKGTSSHRQSHVAVKPHPKSPSEIEAARLSGKMAEAKALIADGNLDDAEKECNSILATHPRDKQWLTLSSNIKAARLLAEANTAFEANDLDTAEAKVNEAHALKPVDLGIDELLSKVKGLRYKEAMAEAQDTPDLEGAVKRLEAILVRFPDDRPATELLDKSRIQLHAKRLADAQSNLKSDPDAAEKSAKAILEKDPNDEDALAVIEKVRLARYIKAIDEAQAKAATDPDSAELAATKALELKPGDPTAKALLATIRANHKWSGKQAAAEQAKTDMAQGQTIKAVQEYKNIFETYPLDTDLRLTAAKAVMDSGSILSGADLAAKGLIAATSDEERHRFELLLSDWRARFEPLNAKRMTAAIELMKLGQAIESVDAVVASSRLLSDRRAGLTTEWLADFAAGRSSPAVEALKEWIKLSNRKVEDVALSPLCSAVPDLVHRAVIDEKSVSLIKDAFGPDGPHQIEVAAGGH